MADFKLYDPVMIYGYMDYVPLKGRIIEFQYGICTGIPCFQIELDEGQKDGYQFINVHPKQCRKLIKKKELEWVRNLFPHSEPDEKVIFYKDIDKPMTFDPTKLVQTRDGKRARIICTDWKSTGNLPISESETPILIALVEHGNGFEEICTYSKSGSYRSLENDPYDLINIPEPKSIDVHVGGVYKCRNGEIAIIKHERENDTFVVSYIESFVDTMYRIKEFLLNEEKCAFELIEHLGDIQSLNSYIAEKLK